MCSHFDFIYNVINKLNFNCTVSYNKKILYLWINLDTIFIIFYYIQRKRVHIYVLYYKK